MPKLFSSKSSATPKSIPDSVSPNFAFGRIPVMDIWPTVGGGSRPAKAVVGEHFPVRASVFREGYDSVAADVVLINPQGREVQRVRMTYLGGDLELYAADVAIHEEGQWQFRIDAYSDPISTWIRRAGVKIPAGVDVELEYQEGRIIFERVIEDSDTESTTTLMTALATLENTALDHESRLSVLADPLVLAAFEKNVIREMVSPYGPFEVLVERHRALYGSWYEFFPRSEGAIQHDDGSWTSGTFKTAARRLPAVAAMGFDVLYLPPIHPVGTAHRKGRNNALVAGPHDPGSPWGIGATSGGHDAVHPDLGTQDDFKEFVQQANALGIEIALDLALQASPDHPWVAQHPQWFTHRADGTIAYAENPPKKYQDIYPLNFDNDPEGIFQEVERVVRHWMKAGVRIFRVDNPHTKPVAFWERLIAAINATDPDVIFLSEAFTNPTMMRCLGEAGFQQSYTYFTWTNTKAEFVKYLEELAGPASAYYRPNFFANTPDILPFNLQTGGKASFAIRATLAATLSPTWGIYTGYELFENSPFEPNSEEYYNSEKYEYVPRDWDALYEQSLAPYITKLNTIRKQQPALQYLRNITFHSTESDSMLVFSKRHGENVVIVVITLNPEQAVDGNIQLNLPALGLSWGDTFTVRDELSGEQWQWQENNYLKIDPTRASAHILTVHRHG